MSQVSAFRSQLYETGYHAICEKKSKIYIAGDINFILKELHDKMGHPGVARTGEFNQQNFDVPSVKQKLQH